MCTDDDEKFWGGRPSAGRRDDRAAPPGGWRGETNGFEKQWKGLLLDSPRSASSIARESGIDGSLLMLELDLYLAVRLTNGGCGFVIESE